jgi:hypothetical protein
MLIMKAKNFIAANISRNMKGCTPNLQNLQSLQSLQTLQCVEGFELVGQKKPPEGTVSNALV